MQRCLPEVLATPINWFDSKILGYHATSVESYNVLKDTGYLPPTPDTGRFHIYPGVHYRRLPNTTTEAHISQGNTALATYGEFNARAHFILSQLGMSPDNTGLGFNIKIPISIDSEATWARYYKYFEKTQVSAENLQRLPALVESSRTRGWVVFGISTEAVFRYGTSLDGLDKRAHIIHAPQGLEIELIPNLRVFGNVDLTAVR